MPITVLTPDVTVLLDTLVRPIESIPADATAIHGISAATVAGAPPFPDLYPQLRALLAQRTIVPYNVAFDRGILAGVLARPQLRRWTCPWQCAMDWWAAYVGDWSDIGARTTGRRAPAATTRRWAIVGPCWPCCSRWRPA